jgi:3-isopropylmalate dehydrogenase
LASILSVALMLEISFKLTKEAEAIIAAVDQALKQGFRTGDIADATTPKDKILGTQAMGEKIVALLS